MLRRRLDAFKLARYAESMPIAKAALLALFGRGERRQEQTMSGNAGGYTVPLGKPLRRTFPTYPDGEDDDDGEELLRRVDEELERMRRSRQ